MGRGNGKSKGSNNTINGVAIESFNIIPTGRQYVTTVDGQRWTRRQETDP